MSQIIIGFSTEGPTDVRFLESVIQRTFDAVAFECERQIEVLPVILIPKENGEFVPRYLRQLRQAFAQGIMVLCIHVDADAVDDRGVWETRFEPLLSAIKAESFGTLCDIVVPVIPVQMTEAWMLADLDLLKDELGTDLSDQDLGIHRKPEGIADPKNTIANAIQLAAESMTRRRRNQLKIGELYQPLGRKISLESLRGLPSFRRFEEAVRSAYRQLKYLQ